MDSGVRGGPAHASLQASDRSCRRAVSDPRSRGRRFLDSGAAQRRDRQFSAWRFDAFDFFLMVAGLYQGIHLGRAVKVGIDEFNASHRPRIRVRDVAMSPPRIIAGQNFAVQFAITNVGDSEAKITEMYATIYMANSPDLPLPMASPPMQRIEFSEEVTKIRRSKVTRKRSSGRSCMRFRVANSECWLRSRTLCLLDPFAKADPAQRPSLKSSSLCS